MPKWLAGLIVILILILLSGTVSVKAGSTEVTGILSLTITGIAASNITAASATITWETNGDSTSQVFYGDKAGSYPLSTPIIDTSPGVSHHSVQLSGLLPGTNYHYQVQSTSTGSSSITAVSGDCLFTTNGYNVSGSGGSPASTKIDVQTGELTSTGSLTVDASGTVQQTVNLESQDHAVTLLIADGTSLHDAQGRPLDTIYARKAGSIPAAPPNNPVVLAYEFGPAGARFNPPLTLTLKYDPAALPAGVPENSLRIVYWDGSYWVEVFATVDTVSHTISARLFHFSLYLLVGEKVPEAAATAAGLPIPSPEDQPSPTAAFEPSEINTPLPAGPASGPAPPVSILILAGVIVAAAIVYVIFKRNLDR